MDKSSKIILTVIALGLWVNIALNTINTAKADADYSYVLSSMERNLSYLVRGGAGCRNTKICD